MTKDLPKGFACKCGHFNRFTGYVYAHWNDVLEGPCERCDTRYSIVRGSAKETRPAAKKSRKAA